MKAVTCLSFLFVALLCGCGDDKPNPYVGTWNGTGQDVTAKFVFQDNGQFLYDTSNGKVTTHLKGWYEQKEDSIVLNVDDVKVDGPTELVSQMEQSISRTLDIKIEWGTSKNEFSINTTSTDGAIKFKKA